MPDDRSEPQQTSRTTLTWLLIVAVIVGVKVPPAGFAAALMVAIVTATRADLRRDLLWSSVVASVTSVLAVITVLTLGDIVG